MARQIASEAAALTPEEEAALLRDDPGIVTRLADREAEQKRLEQLRLNLAHEQVKADTARAGGKLACNGRVYTVLEIHDTHVQVRDDLGELVNWSRASFPPYGAEPVPE